MYDLIIIGLGPAGMNASIYAKRAGLNILVIEKGTPGGTLNTIREVENFIGFEKTDGPSLAMNFYKQFKALNIPLISEEVIDIKDEVNKKVIFTNQNKYEAKAIIIATGRGERKLKMGHNIRGVSYCALCDANLYQNKIIALNGNNPKAVEETLYLSDIASKVYLIIDSAKIKAPANNIKLLNKPNITIINNEEIIDIIESDNIITGLVLKKQNLNIDGLFVNLGYGPATYFCENLGITNKDGYIKVNINCETKVKGIYACGDSVKKDIYQIITAASEGATAAINAHKHIKQIH